MASLMYGSGLRLMECCRLRVKDVDLARGQITVREGKGAHDRVTMLPDSLRPLVVNHLTAVKRWHDRDISAGHGSVALPGPSGRSVGSSTTSRPARTRALRLIGMRALSVKYPGPERLRRRCRGRSAHRDASQILDLGGLPARAEARVRLIANVRPSALQEIA